MPQIASRYRFAIHNNWDMEFDISHISKWDELLQEAKQAPRNSYFFAKAHYLRGTWEKVLLICIPMYGENGEIYGVCGLEISSLLFKLAHAHLSPPLAGLTGVLALRQQDDEGGVSLDTGAGFQDGPALAIPVTTATAMARSSLWAGKSRCGWRRFRFLAKMPPGLPRYCCPSSGNEAC